MCQRYSLRTSRRHPASKTSSSPGSSLDRAVRSQTVRGWGSVTLIGSLCSTYFMRQPLHTNLWVAAAAWRTAGCLCMTGSRAGLKTSPANWRKTDMLPNPEARSSRSRCCPSSADLGPFLWRNANHGKSPPETSRSNRTLCFRNFSDSRHYFLRLILACALVTYVTLLLSSSNH